MSLDDNQPKNIDSSDDGIARLLISRTPSIALSAMGIYFVFGITSSILGIALDVEVGEIIEKLALRYTQSEPVSPDVISSFNEHMSFSSARIELLEQQVLELEKNSHAER